MFYFALLSIVVMYICHHKFNHNGLSFAFAFSLLLPIGATLSYYAFTTDHLQALFELDCALLIPTIYIITQIAKPRISKRFNHLYHLKQYRHFKKLPHYKLELESAILSTEINYISPVTKLIKILAKGIYLYITIIVSMLSIQYGKADTIKESLEVLSSISIVYPILLIEILLILFGGFFTKIQLLKTDYKLAELLLSSQKAN